MEQNELRSLLLRVRGGEGEMDEAFAVLAARFRPLTEGLLHSFSEGLCEADSAELAQEAQYALYRAARTYKIEEDGVTFGLYARVCVRNALVSYLRRHRAQSAAVSSTELDELLLADGEEPIGLLIEAERLAEMQSKINATLSPYERAVFDRFVLGERPAVIAERFGKSEKSVSNAIFRMQTKLRAALGKK